MVLRTTSTPLKTVFEALSGAHTAEEKLARLRSLESLHLRELEEESAKSDSLLFAISMARATIKLFDENRALIHSLAVKLVALESNQKSNKRASNQYWVATDPVDPPVFNSDILIPIVQGTVTGIFGVLTHNYISATVLTGGQAAWVIGLTIGGFVVSEYVGNLIDFVRATSTWCNNPANQNHPKYVQTCDESIYSYAF